MYCPNRECPDREATGVAGEYVDSVTHCPYCRSPLVESPPPDIEADAEPDPQSALEPVFETAEGAELEVAKSILEGAGIEYLVEGMEQLSAFRSEHEPFRFNPQAGSVVIVVPVERAEEARILLTPVEPEEEQEED